ncbi:targeting protein for Xklp2-A-like [Conger conger]|uniref:targeting protein for Xklp2-A-like n=1 Tax=Conger conger TaxID=82655 RepID=UPI002A5A2FB6|nr:targeting protein for Xklp2-A-like [Conger conger]
MDIQQNERWHGYENDTHLNFSEAVTEDNQAVSSTVSSNVVTLCGNQSTEKSLHSPCQRVSRHKPKKNDSTIAATDTPPVKKPRRGASLKHKSSEEQELAYIQTLQDEVAAHRKKNEASYRTAMAGSQPARKPAMSTTIPVDFHFHTDERVKQHARSSDHGEAVQFSAQLRRHPPSPAKMNRGATIPKPFNLSVGKKRKYEESAVYVPMAQQIEQFQKRTPPRYHLPKAKMSERGPPPGKTGRLKITNPKTPRLMTKQRSRPVSVKSSVEMEAEELEKIQQCKFKALELNRKILEGGVLLKKPPVKEVTEPVGFQLEVERRLQERQAARPQEEPQPHSFQPRPLPARILEEVVGVPEKMVKHPTVPESPAFTVKNRVRVKQQVEEVKPLPLKANPVPHFGLPFLPKPLKKSQAEVCPFSFESRERERQALKEKRLEDLRKTEIPKFKAQLLPDFSEVYLPEKKVAAPTKAEPFRLLVDERGANRCDRWEQMIKDEQKQQEKATLFKARPNTVAHKEPFMPKKENLSVLVPQGFQLSTERRAQERQEYERALCEKEAMCAHIEEERRRETEKREEEETTQRRQQQVHKAQPVRRYKPLELKKSEEALTIPQTPKFSDRFRL